MLRVLPYLIILLIVVAFSRLMAFVNDSDWFATRETHAKTEMQIDKDAIEGDSKQSESRIDEKLAESSTDNVLPVIEKKAESEKEECLGPDHFSLGEIKVLQNLKKRREELDKQAEDLVVREGMVNVLMQNADQKIVKLKELQTQVKELLDQYKGKRSDAALKLVKIYENMNAKDAARVFDKLQLPVLLEVTLHMKETKLAAIIAEMIPERAKELTVALSSKESLLSAGMYSDISLNND